MQAKKPLFAFYLKGGSAMEGMTVYQENSLIPAQASHDGEVLAMWLHGKANRTATEYAREAGRFLEAMGKPLRAVTLSDLQGFVDGLDVAPATQARTIATIKSLFSFGRKIGYLQFDPAAVVRSPKLKNRLGERILPESDVVRLIAMENDKRNRALLVFLYATGARISEACRLTWADVQVLEEGAAIVTLYGKGGKTRHVRLEARQWAPVEALREGSAHADPVFRSQKGGFLDQSAVNRVVHAAAKRAGISAPVSPHWLRHAHVSHALDHGAPAHLVQQTAGHESLATTSRYAHARPGESSSRFLAI